MSILIGWGDETIAIAETNAKVKKLPPRSTEMPILMSESDPPELALRLEIISGALSPKAISVTPAS